MKLLFKTGIVLATLLAATTTVANDAIATISHLVGEAYIYPANQLERIEAKAGLTLKPTDKLLTTNNTYVSLNLTGNGRIYVKANSELVLQHHASYTDGRKDVRYGLTYGEATFDTSQTSNTYKRFIVNSNGSRIYLHEGIFDITRHNNAIGHVWVNAGSATVLNNHGKTQVNAGYGLNINRYDPSKTALKMMAPPSLNHDAHWVSWADSEHPYRVEVFATLDNGQTILTDHAIVKERHAYDTRLLPNGRYTITLTTLGENAWSLPNSITADVAHPLTSPQLTKQGSNVVWNAIEGATAYRVEIRHPDQTIIKTFDTPKLMLCCDDLPFGKYTVAVAAVDHKGVSGESQRIHFDKQPKPFIEPSANKTRWLADRTSDQWIDALDTEPKILAKIKWPASQLQSEYELQIARDYGFEHVIHQQVSSLPMQEVYLDPDTHYFFRVQIGNNGKYGSITQFKTQSLHNTPSEMAKTPAAAKNLYERLSANTLRSFQLDHGVTIPSTNQQSIDRLKSAIAKGGWLT